MSRGLALLEKDGVNVAFEVVDRDEGKVVGEGEGFGVGDADEQCTGEAGTGGDGDGVEIGEGHAGFSERGADDRNDGAKMLATGELRNHAAVAGVGSNLRGNDGRKRARSALDNGRGGFVARGLDAEDEAGAEHRFSLVAGESGVGGASGVSGVRKAGKSAGRLLY